MKDNLQAKQKDAGFGASIRAKPVYSRTSVVVAAVADRGCRSHPPSLKLRRTSQLRLQIAALQKNRSGAFHLVNGAIDATRLKFNPAAAVDDDVRV